MSPRGHAASGRMAATSKTKCALGSSTAELGRARGGRANQCLGFEKCTVGTPAKRFISLAVVQQGIAAAAQELAGPGEEELAKRAAAAATALRHDSTAAAQVTCFSSRELKHVTWAAAVESCRRAVAAAAARFASSSSPGPASS